MSKKGCFDEKVGQLAHSASDGLLGGLAGLDGVGELAEVQELECDDLVLVIESQMCIRDRESSFMTVLSRICSGASLLL